MKGKERQEKIAIALALHFMINNISIPRGEFPNPQFEREDWMCLNGEWDFAFDHSDTGIERNMQAGDQFTHKIIVPFAPESSLSEIGYKDFMKCVWYGKTFDLPENFRNGTILLNFGAIDYFAELWINGEYAGFHRGGSSVFSCDITRLVKKGSNRIVLRAYDDLRSQKQPCGKQSPYYYSASCFYTRTTGIWQSVWMEYIPSKNYIKNYRIITEPENKKAFLTVNFEKAYNSGTITAEAFFDGKKAASDSAKVAGRSAVLTLTFDDVKLWDVGKGNLYDLKLTYESEYGKDIVKSYFGMRSVALTDNALLLNGRPVFQRLVLDQGFYPDGIWTAPTEEALKNDILLSLKAGFNGARFHQKVFEPRSLYWADKLGYLVWGENASWGMNMNDGDAFEAFIGEWHEILQRDFNHPSIIGWCPFNETNAQQRKEALNAIYNFTKAFDPVRPVIDTSGFIHVKTDIYDIHDYEQDPEIFEKKFRHMNITDGEFKPYDPNGNPPVYERVPFFVSEYGGTWWNADEVDVEASGWGYGEQLKEIEKVYERLEGLTKALLNNKGICAFCYTQLTDVEQEQNGIYKYDRSEKFDMNRIYKIFSAKAAIEE